MCVFGFSAIPQKTDEYKWVSNFQFPVRHVKPQADFDPLSCHLFASVSQSLTETFRSSLR